MHFDLLDNFIVLVDFERLKLVSSAYLHVEGRPHAHSHPNIVILVGSFQVSHIYLLSLF